MNNLKTATQKHMTLDERISIEKELDLPCLSFHCLGLGKIHHHLSKEIKSTGAETDDFNEPANRVLWQSCKEKYLVPMPVAKRMCRITIIALFLRTLFTRSYVDLLNRPLFVCNGCIKILPLDEACHHPPF